jgi:hypothetical protein
MSIALDIHICDQRRSYKVKFEGDGPVVEARALEFVQARWSTHAIHELAAEPIPPEYGQLFDLLYPTCEHGLDLSNCYGPQHYYFDEEEQARGMLNG